MNSQWDLTVDHVFLTCMAPDLDSALATFTGYIEQHYNDIYQKYAGPGGHEGELIINGETFGYVVGINDAGTCFMLKEDPKNAAKSDFDEDFDEDWEDDITEEDWLSDIVD